MKRTGHLMERMMTPENFILAEEIMCRTKKKNRKARYIRKHAEEFGTKLFEKISAGQFTWHKPKQSTIKDSYKGKERGLKIPCLEDQAAQVAWLNIAAPYIERRNYYYNCGSIPHAGQTRCTKGLKKRLKDNRVKYGAVTDIRKFYDTCPHSLVRRGLKRIFKDKEFIEYAMAFVASMSETGIGLAIGYPSSHWMANIALMELDHELRRRFPDVWFTRYMDDTALVSSNKRHLRKCVDLIRFRMREYGMSLRKWALFRIKDRGVHFLSYRFFNGYTLLNKRLMIRISKRMHKAKDHISAHIAAGVISYLGILKWCDSYNFRVNHVYPYIDPKKCRRMIAYASKNAVQRAA